MKRKFLLAMSAVALIFNVSCGRDESDREEVKTDLEHLRYSIWAYNETIVEYGGKNGGVEVIRYNDDCSSRKIQWFRENYLEERDYVKINNECVEAIHYLKYNLDGKKLTISDGIETTQYELIKVNATELEYRLKEDTNDDGIEDVITYKFNSK